MQFEWNSKDNVSFGLYKEVVESKNAQFLIWLEIDNREVDLVDLRTDGTEYRLNNFIIKENSEKNTITFCPNIAGCPAYFRIKSNEPFCMSVTRKDGTPVDEATFQPGETKIELNPAGMRMYKVNVEGKVLSVPENTTEVRKDAPSIQEETVPEFFDGSFSSTPQQTSASSVSKPSGVVESPIDDANIFVGGFNSESDSGLSHNSDSDSRRSSVNQQTTGNDSNNTMTFFADMFPTAGTRQESLSARKKESQPQSELLKERPFEQNTGFGASPFNFNQDSSSEYEKSSSGSVSGFSVPYIETEGICERRDKIQNLQQDNDKTAQEVEKLEKQIAELESRSRQLSDSKSSLILHLESLQCEYDKDYSKFQADIDEIKGRYTIDQSILEFYKDKDLVPIEDLLRQTDDFVQRCEEQIRLFVIAQQNKSDEIEKALKVGKKE